MRTARLMLVAVAGSDGDHNQDEAWLASVRERMREQRDELLPRPPFPVWGLSSPALRPYALTGIDRDADGWHAVTLRYGASGPVISVRTAPMTRHWKPSATLPAAIRRQPGTLVVASVRTPVELAVEDDWWVAELTAPMGVALTVYGYDVPPESVWLVPVDDLAHYWPSDLR